MSTIPQLQEMEGASRAITLPPSRATQINREHARPGVGAQENRLGHRDGPDLDLKGNREALMLVEATSRRISRSRTRPPNCRKDIPNREPFH